MEEHDQHYKEESKKFWNFYAVCVTLYIFAVLLAALWMSVQSTKIPEKTSLKDLAELCSQKEAP